MNTLICALYGIFAFIFTRLLGMYTIEDLFIAIFTASLIAIHYHLADFNVEHA